MFKVEYLVDPGFEELSGILELFKLIPGRTCSAAAYLDYLNSMWSNIQIVVIRDEDGKIVGFAQAQEPSITEPMIGWVQFACTKPGVLHQYVRQGLKLIEAWLRSRGAKKLYMTSVRLQEKAFERSFEMTPAREVLYEKNIA